MSDNSQAGAQDAKTQDLSDTTGHESTAEAVPVGEPSTPTQSVSPIVVPTETTSGTEIPETDPHNASGGTPVEPPATRSSHIAAISALRDAVVALRDIATHGSQLVNYSSVVKVFDDSVADIDDILRAA